MALYLYAIGAPGHPDPGDISGVDGAPVRGMDVAGFRCWISDLHSAPAASLDRARSHNAVVEASLEEHTPLPMRFGQWFASESELRSALRERGKALRRALERVDGAVEFGVRVLDPSSKRVHTPDRSSGRAYLEGLARREAATEQARRRGAEVASALRTELGDLVRAQAVRPGDTTALVAIAHLVDRHDTGSYRRRVHTFTERRQDLRFVTTGPWPPYGFVDEEASG